MAEPSVRQIPAERQRVAESKWEWEKVILRSDLSQRGRLCALVICSHMDPDGTNACPEEETIAREMGVSSTDTVWRAKKELRDFGFLTWKGGKGPGNQCRYIPLVPAKAEKAQPQQPPAENSAPLRPQTPHPCGTTKPTDQTNNMMMDDLTDEEFNSIVATQAATISIDPDHVRTDGSKHRQSLRQAVAEKRNEGWTVEEIAHAGWDWSNNEATPIVHPAAWIARRIARVQRKPILDEHGRPTKPKKKPERRAKRRRGGVPDSSASLADHEGQQPGVIDW